MLDPKDISFFSKIALTLTTLHPIPDTELVLTLGHQRRTKVCTENSIPRVGRTSRVVCLTYHVLGPAKHTDASHETLMYAKLVNFFFHQKYIYPYWIQIIPVVLHKTHCVKEGRAHTVMGGSGSAESSPLLFSFLSLCLCVRQENTSYKELSLTVCLKKKMGANYTAHIHYVNFQPHISIRTSSSVENSKQFSSVRAISMLNFAI